MRCWTRYPPAGGCSRRFVAQGRRRSRPESSSGGLARDTGFPEGGSRGDKPSTSRRAGRRAGHGHRAGQDAGGGSVYIGTSVNAETAEPVEMGFGADWWMPVWVNGTNCWIPPLRATCMPTLQCENHLVQADLRAGDNLIVIRLVSGSGSSGLADAGPSALRHSTYRTNCRPQHVRSRRYTSSGTFLRRGSPSAS